MRYKRVKIFENNDLLYKNKLLEKDKLFFRQYESVKMKEVLEEDYDKFDIKSHTWTQGDTLEKLSSRFYGNPRYWFLIAYYNSKPTEYSLENGETIYIALPLEKILNHYNKG